MDQLWGVDISGGSVERVNLTPDRDAIGHHLSVVGRRQQVPTDPEMRRNAAERRRNRWACLADVKRFIARSRCRVG